MEENEKACDKRKLLLLGDRGGEQSGAGNEKDEKQREGKGREINSGKEKQEE